MSNRKQQFANEEIYHIVVRRIGDDLLFKNIDDYYRGIFSIYEFNNKKTVSISRRRRDIQSTKKFLKFQELQSVQGRTLNKSIQDRTLKLSDNRELLVEILTFCFMPNHIHLLVRQLKDGGISKFMQKLGTGYPGYFKRKYNLERRGHFFQERFVAVHIKTDEQLKAVFAYIHTNPLSLIEPKWKKGEIKNIKKAIKFLENYKWSSYLDYIGKKNFPSITERKFLLETMGEEQGCKDFINNWIRYKGEIKKFPELFLEE